MKLAFVAPFFGPEAAGGAEHAARSLAWKLAEHPAIEVEILTTCLKDLASGLTGQTYPVGEERDGPLRIRRFPVPQADMQSFGPLNMLIRNRVPLSPSEERQFMTRHVTSPDLLRWMHQHRHLYQKICFIPYLFGTTCFGVPLVAEQSVILPCLHDEGYAQLDLVRRMFAHARHIICNTDAEQRLVESLFPHEADSKAQTVGLGLDVNRAGNAERFRQRFGIREPFVLYAGRRDTTKNVHSLITYFLHRTRSPGMPGKLVLIGPAPLPYSGSHPDLIDLGFVSEQDKLDAMCAASVFCQPSRNESFSYVIMEAWLCGTPVLVHAQCPVTRDHVLASGGGLLFENAAEFSATLHTIVQTPDLRARMARAGEQYVRANYAWPRVIARFLRALEVAAPPARTPTNGRTVSA